jgi:ribosomal protein S18 acetylase RimI-like enzyme
VRLRAPREDETAEVAELLTAAADESGLGSVEPEEVAQWFSLPTFDVAGNFRVAERDGTLLAYCDLSTSFDGHTRVFMDLRSAPGAGEAAAEVLDWACVRARELASGRTVLRTGVPERDVAKRRLLEERGFAVVRHSLQMLIDFEREPEPPRWPEGIALAQLDPGRNDRAAFDAFRETFRDAWGFAPTPFEQWRHIRLAAPDFDPALHFLACDADEIAGLSFCVAESSRHPGYGWVNTLGVRRRWRKRGLGEALLRHSFGELQRRGCRGAGLDVDADNLTGATRLYERVGMRVVSRGDTYELEVRPG